MKPALDAHFPNSKPFFKEIACFDISANHQLGPELDKLAGLFRNATLIRRNSTITDIFDLKRQEPLFDNGFDIVYFDLRQFIDPNLTEFMLKFTLIADELFNRPWKMGVPGRVFIILKLASSKGVDLPTLSQCLPSFIETNPELKSAYDVTFGFQENLERALQEINMRRRYSRGIRIKATGMAFTKTDNSGEMLVQFGFDFYAPNPLETSQIMAGQ